MKGNYSSKILEYQPGEANRVPKPEEEFHVLERESVRFHWEQMLSSPMAPDLAADGPVSHVSSLSLPTQHIGSPGAQPCAG